MLFVKDIYTKEKEGYKKLKWGQSLADIRKSIGTELDCKESCCSFEDKLGPIKGEAILYFYKGQLYKVDFLFSCEGYYNTCEDEILELTEVFNKKFGSPFYYLTVPVWKTDETIIFMLSAGKGNVFDICNVAGKVKVQFESKKISEMKENDEKRKKREQYKDLENEL